MDVCDAEGFEVIEVVEHAFEVSSKAVDVEDVTHHVFGQEPIRRDVSGEVEGFQVGGAVLPVLL